MQQALKAIIKISGRDVTVTKDMILSTFSLKKEVNEIVTMPVIVCFDEKDNIINQICTVTGVVKNNYKDKKVHSFKMRNRTRTRRLRGSRAHCTTIKITNINVGGK